MELTEKEELARQKVCMPLDGLAKLKDLRARIEDLSPVVGLFKIGKEANTRFGHDPIHILRCSNTTWLLYR